MGNTLFLPEVREMLTEQDREGLQQFATALNPARTAEFMDGLTPEEAWQVLKNVDSVRGADIFMYFEHDRQIDILRTQSPSELALLICELSADDRVDLLQELDTDRVQELISLLPAAERREEIGRAHV